MKREKKGRPGRTARKIAAMLTAAFIFSTCGCGQAWEGAETAAWEADYFAYTDEENCLYLWKQGMEEPILLTDKAFAKGALKAGEPPEEGMGEVPGAGKEAPEKDMGEVPGAGKEAPENTPDEGKEPVGEDGEEVFKYWEEWDYWQEWGQAADRWVWNYETALQGTLLEGPGQALYFPQKMRWENMRMQRSSGEKEEAQKYAHGDTVNEYVDVKLFLYDLYCYDMGLLEEDSDGDGQEPFAQTEKIADNILYYRVDRQGNVWYCRIEGKEEKEDGAEKDGGEGREFAKSMLYRYDGEETVAIAEINGRKQDAFRVSQNGEAVLFYALDDGLYICSPGEEAAMLAEKTNTDMFTNSDVYANADMSRIIYAVDDKIHIIEDGKGGTEWQIEETGEYLEPVMLGEAGDKIFTLSLDEETPYTDWIERGEGAEEEEAEAEKWLWEMLEENSHSLYPVRCHARVLDISSSPAKCIQEEEGYLLWWPSVDGMGHSRKVYSIEMIPADSFEKFSLSEILGEKIPSDVLEAYEREKSDEFYADYYGEESDARFFSNAFLSCMDTSVLESRGEMYAITEKGIYRIEGFHGEIGMADGGYGEDGDNLYVRRYQYVEQENGGYFYPFTFYSGYLEDWFVFDNEGGCEMVAEAADEGTVRGNEVFYTRETGMERKVGLYRSSALGRIAEAESIPLDSLQKSCCSDAILFVAEGLRPEQEEEGVYAESEKALLVARYRSILEEEDGKEGMPRPALMLEDGSGARVIGEDVYEYGFYGTDGIWMLQNEEREESLQGNTGEWYDEEESWKTWEEEEEEKKKGGSRLYVYENGEKRQIAERAVWMVKPGYGQGKGYAAVEASWVRE